MDEGLNDGDPYVLTFLFAFFLAHDISFHYYCSWFSLLYQANN